MFGWTHGGFIVLGYAITALVLIGLVVWVVIDHRAQKRRIAELEARGARRRSAGRPVRAPDPGAAS